MKKLSHYRIFLAGALLLLLNTSCLKKQFEEQEQEEKNKINTYLKAHQMDESHNIGNGIYLKFSNDTNVTDGSRPVTGNTILVSYAGKYTDGTIFECTDSATGMDLFENRYVVYGPQRLKVGTLVTGVDYAIRKFQIGDQGTIVIPSNYAFYDYEPIVYEIKVLDIIPNDSIYEKSLMDNYITNNGFNENDTTLFGDVFYKGTPKNIENDSFKLKYGDSVTVKIRGSYAEDYYADHTGRVFYPLFEAKEEISWMYANVNISFPITQYIEKTLTYMEVGDTMEIVCPSSYAYGKNGFYNPYLLVPIVPGYMPVHFRLILTGIKRDE